MIRTSKRITLTNNTKVLLAKDKYDNIISLNNIEFEMQPLYKNIPGNRGGNSTVLKLLLASDEDQDDIDSEIELVIKISNIDVNDHSNYSFNRKRRFQREILALRKAEKKKLKNVVRIIHDGSILIEGKEFLFYTMERANADLTDYLKIRRSIQQKIFLFQSILQGMRELHELEIYHRDIKNDNIFIYGDECKVGDLGLIRFKSEDVLALDDDQRIGAFGWECPEAMNFFFSERAPDNPEFTFDDKIDEASDIFQLGKLFWYILQGNLPIGCIEPEDFRIADQQLFNVLLLLLQHGKTKHRSPNRRPLTIRDVQAMVAGIARKYAA